MSQLPPLRCVRLSSAEPLTRDIKLFRFTPTDGSPVVEASAGAHLDVHLPNGLVRPYSLILDGESSRSHYVIAVKKEVNGRGGSAALHDDLPLGSELRVGSPRNSFALVEDGAHSVLIAGGIGITPLWSMLQRLEALGRSFQLHYACRTRADVAFRDRLAGRPGVHLHVDEDEGRVLDIAAICDAAPPGAHLYCCGPAPMIAAFGAATERMPRDHVHVEHFGAVAQGGTLGFELELARSGRVLWVDAGQRIVDVLRGASIDATVSCEQGVCGACETRVLAGIPEHRCQVLTPPERESNQTMMICCGGSREARLVLDL